MFLIKSKNFLFFDSKQLKYDCIVLSKISGKFHLKKLNMYTNFRFLFVLDTDF